MIVNSAKKYERKGFLLYLALFIDLSVHLLAISINFEFRMLLRKVYKEICLTLDLLSYSVTIKTKFNKTETCGGDSGAVYV